MLATFTAIYEMGNQYYIGYCPEVPGANGQGATLAECRESLREAIRLILEDRLEEGLRGVPAEAIREALVVYETA
jgi:predicted RNase H-like HicB family nuclease